VQQKCSSFFTNEIKNKEVMMSEKKMMKEKDT
jgi:hypothetical protein